MATNNSLRNNRSFHNSSFNNSQSAAGVRFVRRTSTGRYVNYSQGDQDSEFGSVDFTNSSPPHEYVNYHVQIPATPDNQPMSSMEITMEPTISARVEEQYVSNSLFTGGFNTMTRAHLMDKVIESETAHPQMAGAKGSQCAVEGCNSKIMSDERGMDILPCECGFKICADCFNDAVKAGGTCPGCKEPYRVTELEEMGNVDADRGTMALPPPPGAANKMQRRLSLVKSMRRSQTGDWDQNKWLFETKGTYGYGNAIWPTENGGDGAGGDGMSPAELNSRPWRPLTRKIKVPAAILSPYRLLVFIRLAVLGLFLAWRAVLLKALSDKSDKSHSSALKRKRSKKR